MYHFCQVLTPELNSSALADIISTFMTLTMSLINELGIVNILCQQTPILSLLYHKVRVVFSNHICATKAGIGLPSPNQGISQLAITTLCACHPVGG